MRKAPGVVVHGVVQGRFPRVMGEGHFYQIRLYNEVEIVKQGGVVEIAERGDVVNLDETGNLRAVKPAMDEGDNVVWAMFIDKKKQRRDPAKTYWDIDVQTSDEEIPF